MGCFLGCFGGEKDHKGRKQRINRGSPKAQRNRVKKNVPQENEIGAEQIEIVAEKIGLVTELLNKPVEEKLPSSSPSPSRSPRKRVTFNSNVTTYEHVSVQERIDSLPQSNTNIEKENEPFISSCQSVSVYGYDTSVMSSVGSYPQNHRYHKARDSDDEEEYGDSDLEDLDKILDEEEYGDYEDSDEEINVKISGQQVWSESVLTESDGSDVQNPSLSNEAESHMVILPKTNARDRCEYVNSVLNPVENIAQWKAAKSKGKANPLKAQKENFSANFEAPPRLSFSSEPTVFNSKINKPKGENREVEVNTSLSSWLVSPEVSNKTISSAMSFEDRPILGAWTVDELRHISASSSPRKSPAQIPDERPIVGSVGTYWNNSSSAKRSDIGSITSKYKELYA